MAESQKLARGASHTVGARTYRNSIPLSIFSQLPEKIQAKIKAAVKKEEEAAAKLAKSNETQAEKTAANQEQVKKEKAEKEAKPGKG